MTDINFILSCLLVFVILFAPTLVTIVRSKNHSHNLKVIVLNTVFLITSSLIGFPGGVVGWLSTLIMYLSFFVLFIEEDGELR